MNIDLIQRLCDEKRAANKAPFVVTTLELYNSSEEPIVEIKKQLREWVIEEKIQWYQTINTEAFFINNPF